MRALRQYYNRLQLLADFDPLVGREALGAAHIIMSAELFGVAFSAWGLLTARWGRQQRGQ